MFLVQNDATAIVMARAFGPKPCGRVRTICRQTLNKRITWTIPFV